ncbi:MAG TPA: amino acid permease [Vicinamibacterales bacterium]
MGFWMAVSLVIGNMIGSGVFLLPASLAAFQGLGLAAWLVTAGGAACLALVFARLARLNPAAGGLYAYTREGFGDLPAFLVAWGYWISSWAATAALAIAGVGYLDPFIPSIVRSPAKAGALAIGMVWLFTFVNSIGIRTAGRVQVATTALKILPLALIGIGGMFFFDAGAFEIAATGPREAAASLSAAATLTLWAFLGLESATIPAGSIEDPARTIPRATVAGTLIAAAIYIVSTVGVMSLVPAEALATTTAPFADAARALMGDTAAGLVALGAAVSCFGALNGWVLIVGQLPMAVARDGLFPPIFSRVGATGTPVPGMVIAAILSSALIALNFTRGLVELFTFIILLSTLATLVPYLFCSLATFLTGREPLTHGMKAVAGMAFTYALWAVFGAGQETVFWGFLLLMAGLPVFVWIRRSA